MTWNPEAHNISPFERITSNLFPVTKERRWTIAGIAKAPMSKADKISDDFSWPIDIYGNPKHVEGAVKVTEVEVIESYERNLLCFYPDQGNYGSGWWRNRPRQCADMGCVLYIPDAKEASLFGPSYVGHTIESLEAMTTNELIDLANQQRADYYESNPLDKEAQELQVSIALNV